MKSIRYCTILMFVLICVLLLLIGCQPVNKGETPEGATTTTTTKGFLLQEPDGSNDTGDNEIDLFEEPTSSSTGNGSNSSGSSSGTSSTSQVQQNGTSTTTTTKITDTATNGQSGVSTSPYDNENNWVDGPIPTR